LKKVGLAVDKRNNRSMDKTIPSTKETIMAETREANQRKVGQRGKRGGRETNFLRRGREVRRRETR